MSFFFHESDQVQNLTISAQTSNNTIVIGRGCRLRGRMTFDGTGHHLAVISDMCVLNSLNATFRGGPASLFVGRDAYSNGVDFLCQGPGNSIQVGDEALFSWSVSLRTSDSHGIFSLDDLSKTINLPESVVIEPHVWISADVTVMKGSRIGRGAIVGNRALVTGDLKPCCLYVGAPARCVREQVSWTILGTTDFGRDATRVRHRDRTLTLASTALVRG